MPHFLSVVEYYLLVEMPLASDGDAGTGTATTRGLRLALFAGTCFGARRRTASC